MPITSINTFRNIAQSAPKARVFVKNDELSSGVGVVQWIKGHILTSHNRKATNLFIRSLKQNYGDDIANTVSKRTDLNQLANNGKTLRSRQITSALDLADKLKSDFAAANESAILNYSRVSMKDGKEVSLLGHAIDTGLRKLAGKDGDISALKKVVNTDEVADNMRTALIDNKLDVLGDEKAPKLISVDDISKHVEHSLGSKVHEHYCSRLREVLGSTNDSSSNVVKTLHGVAAQSGANIDVEKLPASIKSNLDDQINNKISQHVSRSIKNILSGKEKGPLIRLLDEKNLQDIVGRVMQSFVSQRLTAHDKAHKFVSDLPNQGVLAEGITSEDQKKILDFSLHNNVDGEYIAPLSHNIVPMRQAINELATLNVKENPKQYTANIKLVHDVLTNAMNAKGEYIDADTRSDLLKDFSKFYLQSSSPEAKQQMLENLKNPDGPFAKIIQACEYTRHELPNSQEGLSTDPDVMEKMDIAAKKANTAQQALSAFVAELENEVGADDHFTTGHIPIGQLPQGHIDAVQDSLGFEIPHVHPLDQPAL